MAPRPPTRAAPPVRAPFCTCSADIHIPATPPGAELPLPADIDHSGAGNDRSSWDPATTLLAVRGAGEFYSQVYGTNIVDPATGNNRWVNGSSKQSYVVQ